MENNITFTQEYAVEPLKDVLDLRDAIHPKKEGHHFVIPPYKQVFGREFVPDLSIIDLLFCQGPASEMILSQANQDKRNDLV